MSVNRILIITSEFPPNVGGIGNHAFNLAKSLTSLGNIVTVVADSIDKSDKELKLFAQECLFEIVWVKRRRPLFLVYIKRILASVKMAENAEKIICSGKFSLWIAILLKWVMPHKELIAVVHGSELDLRSGIPKAITTYALCRFKKIIAVSEYTKKFLPVKLPLAVQLFVIPNGINLKEFSGIKKIQLSGNPALITVGSVSERKGQRNVIAALPEIRKFFPQVIYHCVGKPILQSKFEEQARLSGVFPHVFFHGEVARQKLLQELCGSTIKLMLSNHTKEGDFEGFGIAVLEANALGIPVIGSKNSGIANAIDNGKTGLLVDPHKPEEIVRAIKTILAGYHKFSTQAKAWATQHDWKIIVKEYAAVLRS